jgi:hypothetical protein
VARAYAGARRPRGRGRLILSVFAGLASATVSQQFFKSKSFKTHSIIMPSSKLVEAFSLASLDFDLIESLLLLEGAAFWVSDFLRGRESAEEFRVCLCSVKSRTSGVIGLSGAKVGFKLSTLWSIRTDCRGLAERRGVLLSVGKGRG